MVEETATVHFGYGADAIRAAALDRRVRGNLAASLGAIADALASNGFMGAHALHELAERVAVGPVRPLVFALYTSLVDAIQSDDDDAVARGVERLAAIDRDAAVTLRIVDLFGAELGAEASELYAILLDDDPDAPVEISGVGGEAFASGRARVLDALALLDSAAPAFGAEVRVFCNEIVFAGSATGFGANSFSSASSPYLWGGIQLDPARASRIALAETLVHEASHTLLNGLVDAGELSTNPKDARYSSPLRVDARPMDGIIHATYVLGRMGMALAEIAEAGDLTDAERRDVDRRRRENAALFQQGLATIREHGQLTPAGAAALEGCFALGGVTPAAADA